MPVRTNVLIAERTLAALVTSTNAFFAPLLNALVEQFDYEVLDENASRGQEYTIAIQVTDGGVLMSNPFVLNTFGGRNPVEAMSNFVAFVTANPALFISEPEYRPFSSEQRRQFLYPFLACSNVDAVNGALNWNNSGGGGGGILAGDSSGPIGNNILFAGQVSTSPGAVLTALDSVAAATYKTVWWAVEAIKGTNTYSSEMRVSHDGTTAVWVEVAPVLAPGIGTFDFVNSADVSAGLLRLLTTPASGGWTFRVRQITRLTA